LYLENKLNKGLFKFENIVLKDTENIVPLISRSLIRNKLYEVGELEAIGKLNFYDNHFIDLGSSIGITTLSVAQKAEDKIIISVEPVREFLNYSRKNLDKYGNNSNNYIFINKAIYYGKTRPKIIKKNNSLEGVLDENFGLEIEKTNITSIVESYNLTNFNILIDLEGFSFEPFIEEPEIFKFCEKLIIEESFKNSEEKNVFIEKLRDLGFKVKYEKHYWNSTIIGASK